MQDTDGDKAKASGGGTGTNSAEENAEPKGMELPPLKQLGRRQSKSNGKKAPAWVPQMRFVLRFHQSTVNDCCVDPRGQLVATVSDDQAALVYKAETGQQHQQQNE